MTQEQPSDQLNGATDRTDPGDVWPFESHPGYRRVIESVGTVVAPLLAGFSFTLFVLVLPSLARETTTIRVGATTQVTTETAALSRFPGLAALLLLLAGLLLVAAVQAALTSRYYGDTPTELEEWFPEYFREGGAEPPAEWLARSSEEWAPLRVGGKWYRGFIRHYFQEEQATALRWAEWVHRFYRAGILALLAGLTALAVPPEDDGRFVRWALAGVALAGTLAEVIWIRHNLQVPLSTRLRRLLERLSRHSKSTEGSSQSASRDAGGA